MKNVIYSSGSITLRSGGPAGYLANLKLGLDLSGQDHSIVFCCSGVDLSEAGTSEVKKSTFRKKISSRIRGVLNPHQSLKRTNRRFQKLVTGETTLDQDFVHRIGPVKTLHAHSAADACDLLNWRKKYPEFSGIRIIFTSHCPESLAIEINNSCNANGVPEKLSRSVTNLAREIEQKAFTESDIWIFPCEEALDPYVETIPSFAKWKQDKKVRYLYTGCKRPAVRDNYPTHRMNGKKVISFVGRHCEVKGYDLFVQVCRSIMLKRDDIMVLAAGVVEDSIHPIDQNWIELGWYAWPGEILEQSDVFVLPNRRTFFDLVLLEALAQGAAIVTTNTGGNKAVGKSCPDTISLCSPDAKALESEILMLLDDDELRSKRKVNAKNAYESHFTLAAFASRYINAVELTNREI